MKIGIIIQKAVSENNSNILPEKTTEFQNKPVNKNPKRYCLKNVLKIASAFIDFW